MEVIHWDRSTSDYYWLSLTIGSKKALLKLLNREIVLDFNSPMGWSMYSGCYLYVEELPSIGSISLGYTKAPQNRTSRG